MPLTRPTYLWYDAAVNVIDQGTWCIAVPHTSLPADGDRMIVNDQLGHRTVTVSRPLASILGCMRRLRALDDHMAELRRFAWVRENPAFASDALAELARRGLLISSRQLLERVAACDGSDDGAAALPVSTVAWVTRNRPQAIALSVQSYRRNTQHFGHTPRFLVADDSDPEGATETRSALHELAAGTGTSIHLLDACGKRELVRLLARLVPGSEGALEFALFDPLHGGLTYGANRNAALLLTAGELAMFSDDDVLCRLTTRPADGERAGGGGEMPKGALRLRAPYRPDDISFHADRAETLGAHPEEHHDLIGEHTRLLGRRLGGLVSETLTEGRIDLDIETDLFVLRIAQPDARVVLTAAGSYGDSGMPNHQIAFSLRGQSLAAMLDGPGLAGALTTREVSQGVNLPTVSQTTFVAGMNFCLDGGETLPPFLPFARGEDTAFAAALGACRPTSLVGVIPPRVLHAPPDARGARTIPLERGPCTMMEIVMAALGSLRTRGSASGELFAPVGTWLQALASGDFGQLADVVREYRAARMSSTIGYIEESISRHPEHSAWAGAAEREIERLRQSLLEPEEVYPWDLAKPFGRTANAARRLAGQVVCRYGELLVLWPAIMQAARENHEEVAALAGPV